MISNAIPLPRRGRGRQSAAAEAEYQRQRATFCEAMLEIRSTLDFRVSARGWGYIFENRGTIGKDELDLCEKLINDCRKSGELPLDICAVDESRAFDNVEDINDLEPEDEAQSLVDWLDNAHRNYDPHSFWEFQGCYVQMVVEKIDLKSLFSPVCAEFCVPVANAKGWADINLRADMMQRCAEWDSRGKQGILLYCGDHDPAGLNISEFLRGNMADLERAVGWSPRDLIIDRFGLNFDFIEANELTWIDNLITGSGERLDDPNHKDHAKPYVRNYVARYGARKVEANALVVRPEAGRRLCREAILRYIDPDRVPDWQIAVEEKRAAVAAAIQRLLAERRAL
jgi:hypothetical protein